MKKVYAYDLDFPSIMTSLLYRQIEKKGTEVVRVRNLSQAENADIVIVNAIEEATKLNEVRNYIEKNKNTRVVVYSLDFTTSEMTGKLGKHKNLEFLFGNRDESKNESWNKVQRLAEELAQ
jgi:hypothetical protein